MGKYHCVKTVKNQHRSSQTPKMDKIAVNKQHKMQN